MKVVHYRHDIEEQAYCLCQIFVDPETIVCADIEKVTCKKCIHILTSDDDD